MADLDALLDQIVIPRPNGSANLDAVAAFIAATLREHSAQVTLQPFPATPHGLQLVWTVAFLLVVGYTCALAARRYVAGFALVSLAVALLLVEFELLYSPVSGLITREEVNVLGTFAGRPDGPTLVVGAHYDSITHYGDHLIWHRAGRWLGPTTVVALIAAAIGSWRRRRGHTLPWPVRVLAGLVLVVPYGAMTFFFAVGPLVRAPSPGALDNGGSVAALLETAKALERRPRDPPTTVILAFFAAEEERALGSQHFAAGIAHRRDPGGIAVVNLEGVGTGDRLTYVPDDGFRTRRWNSPPGIVALLNRAGTDGHRPPLEPQALPPDTLTDGRSFLAAGIPAVTLRGVSPAGFPRALHSHADRRERLSLPAIRDTVDFLTTLVAHIDANPDAVAAIARDPGGA